MYIRNEFTGTMAHDFYNYKVESSREDEYVPISSLELKYVKVRNDKKWILEWNDGSSFHDNDEVGSSRAEEDI